ncbi:Short-chain dehydrogenase [Ruminococcaceae bacterium YRB3002]|nr:Short-chain dehydrogenase [Ruminococcaceae bacterium YRB3002]
MEDKTAQTVVITGSSRGFGLCQAKKFKELGCNVVISGVNETNLAKALAELEQINPQDTRAVSVVCNVTERSNLEKLWDSAADAFGGVDIWVNNAGVNSPDRPVCELTEREINNILDVDLKGVVSGTAVAFAGMRAQGYGKIYNVEGYGSNDAMMTGLTMYGTAKRAVTYFTRSMARESHDLTGDCIKVCRLSPGIMITDFITHANGGETSIVLSDKTKKFYNIVADYPETVVDYVVPRMITNDKNDAKIEWLTGAKVAVRFLTAGFRKRDFFAGQE